MAKPRMTLKIWRSRISRHESRGSADVAKSDMTSPECRLATSGGDKRIRAALYGYCSISATYSHSVHARPDLCSDLLDDQRACAGYRPPVSSVSCAPISDNVSPGTSPNTGSGNPPDPRPPPRPHASDHPATEVAAAAQGSECRSSGKVGPSGEWSNAALRQGLRCRVGQSAGSIGC